MPAASLTLGPAAAADNASRRACVNAFEQGQVARREGKFLVARDHFARCASSPCPRVLTGDCARWLSEVEERIPSVLWRPEREVAGAAPSTSLVVAPAAGGALAGWAGIF